MLKFFRKIRQQLLSENSFSKYLLYAAGEILLVMIGILLALQVNNWNENLRNQFKETLYLNALFEEIKQDTASLEKIYQKFEKVETATRYVLEVIEVPDKKVIDTLKLLNNLKLMVAFDQDLPEPIVWQELQSTGNLTFIQDRTLIKQLYNYYAKIKNCERDFENNAQPFINQGRYFDSANSPIKIQDDFFQDRNINTIPSEENLQIILNSTELKRISRGILTGMLISKNVLRGVINRAKVALNTLEQTLKIAEQ